MKTLGTARWLPSPTHLQFISGPGEVANDYNTLESIHAPRGQYWKLEVLFIRRTARHHTSLSLDTSHTIPTRVLHFGPSRRPRLPPVRPVFPTGQTSPLVRPVWSTGQTSPALSSTRRASGLGFRLNQGTSSGFVVNHW